MNLPDPHPDPFAPSGGSLGPGKLVGGKYRLTEKLGEGAFGVVYGAENDKGIPYAVKIIRPPTVPGRSALANFEIEALEELKHIHHTHLLRTFDYFWENELLVIVMDRAERTLYDLIKDGGPGLPVNKLLDYMTEAAEALDFLHDRKIIHRDVKPANILLMSDGHVRVADFSLAKALPDFMTSMKASRAVGTPAYMAPETYSDDNAVVHPAGDLFSLAVSYLELRLGHWPKDANSRFNWVAFSGNKPNLEDIPEPEKRVILKALARNPVERHRRCQEFVLDLRQAVARGTPGLFGKLVDRIRRRSTTTPPVPAAAPAPPRTPVAEPTRTRVSPFPVPVKKAEPSPRRLEPSPPPPSAEGGEGSDGIYGTFRAPDSGKPAPPLPEKFDEPLHDSEFPVPGQDQEFTETLPEPESPVSPRIVGRRPPRKWPKRIVIAALLGLVAGGVAGLAYHEGELVPWLLSLVRPAETGKGPDDGDGGSGASPGLTARATERSADTPRATERSRATERRPEITPQQIAQMLDQADQHLESGRLDEAAKGWGEALTHLGPTGDAASRERAILGQARLAARKADWEAVRTRLDSFKPARPEAQEVGAALRLLAALNLEYKSPYPREVLQSLAASAAFARAEAGAFAWERRQLREQMAPVVQEFVDGLERLPLADAAPVAALVLTCVPDQPKAQEARAMAQAVKEGDLKALQEFLAKGPSPRLRELADAVVDLAEDARNVTAALEAFPSPDPPAGIISHLYYVRMLVEVEKKNMAAAVKTVPKAGLPVYENHPKRVERAVSVLLTPVLELRKADKFYSPFPTQQQASQAMRYLRPAAAFDVKGPLGARVQLNLALATWHQVDAKKEDRDLAWQIADTLVKADPQLEPFWPTERAALLYIRASWYPRTTPAEQKTALASYVEAFDSVCKLPPTQLAETAPLADMRLLSPALRLADDLLNEPSGPAKADIVRLTAALGQGVADLLASDGSKGLRPDTRFDLASRSAETVRRALKAAPDEATTRAARYAFIALALRSLPNPKLKDDAFTALEKELVGALEAAGKGADETERARLEGQAQELAEIKRERPKK